MDSKKNLENAIQQCWDDNPSNEFNIDSPIVRLHEPTFNADEIIAFTTQMLTTKVTMGAKVTEFEKKYCSKYSYAHGVSNNSGSSANLLMLSVLTSKLTENNLQKGDEIILPALTWSTTVWPVIQMGLIPVYVDCDLSTFNMDSNKIEEAV
ncbi:MAG: DegT/DnrJ/EryC1/StrS family aminotransferase, partial [Bacteroidia bacterium]|nr:DegT/DnrJ/EryC1/StrS family aminotransferase [Bacteroidia bacterium]